MIAIWKACNIPSKNVVGEEMTRSAAQQSLGIWMKRELWEVNIGNEVEENY